MEQTDQPKEQSNVTSYIQQLGGNSDGLPPPTIWTFRRAKSFKNKNKNKKPTISEESDESSTDEDDIGKCVYSDIPQSPQQDDDYEEQVTRTIILV